MEIACTSTRENVRFRDAIKKVLFSDVLHSAHNLVLEEAPSSFVTPELRKEMGEQAVALCKKVFSIVLVLK